MSEWTANNALTLLENGDDFFPRVCAAIGAAREEVLLETFAWFEDEAGHALQRALIDAARRGARVHATVDGFGTPGFSAPFLTQMTDAGVHIDSFDAQPALFGFRTNLLCRLHRKIIVIDGMTAFVGGINFGADHLRSFGSESKQDYAVEVEGPAVTQIRRECLRFNVSIQGVAQHFRQSTPGRAQLLFAIRDNDTHTNDIETLYRAEIQAAKTRIVIANAYFFPGYRLIRELTRAARRGVDVRLILQGKPDRPRTIAAASILYADLLAAGVRIFEYTERPLHAKVALIDDCWATVGSSNLDPVSLGLNLEANLFIRDEDFNRALRTSLERLIAHSCRELPFGHVPKKSISRRFLLTLAYHLTRGMHAWGRRVPWHKQRIRPLRPAGTQGGRVGRR